ncbi:helix-turn-helix domain-containing protein [Erythrobacter donghaensis]|uniref:helix-turn-helix domain-containing protein n=1 Tax=Erythrobacter donghaensis TaxID=267135 RepID=UPI000A393C5C|nr:helix-turn-helix domain-containing protein [Erythrobacter donghaensis]
MDSEEPNSADTAPELPLAGPGATLRRAREEQGFDIAHVAALTRIPRRHLEAIEADDFESLPSRAYAIGFSRTFAQAVGLDPAKITDAVRAELADGSMRRVVPSATMEPGDPARLPSSGLVWAMGAAVLVFAVGAFAFYNSYFGAGSVPGSLIEPEATASPALVAAAPSAAPEAAAGGAVVLTALEEGVWLRLYEEGGERLVERTLKQGETITVPATATDPRINTGRPDALGLTVGGKDVARLADRPVTIAGAPVSAAALLARAPTPAAVPSAAPVATGAQAPALRPAASQTAAVRTTPVSASVSERASAPPSEPATAPEPAPAGER